MKKRSKNTLRKSDVFFLDRNLGSEKLAALLRPHGFTIITHHDRYGPQAQTVEDPQIIADCGRLRNILLTADGNLEYSFAAEIISAGIAILLLNNNSEGPSKWGPRIIAALPEITRELRQRKKPFLIRLAADGTIVQVRLYRKRSSRVVRVVTPKDRQRELEQVLSGIRSTRAGTQMPDKV